MAPQVNEERDDDFYHSRKSRINQVRYTSTADSFASVPTQMGTSAIVDSPTEVSSYDPTARTKYYHGPSPPTERPSWVTNPGGWSLLTGTLPWITVTSATALWEGEGWQISQATTASTPFTTDDVLFPTSSTNGYGMGRPDWQASRKGLHGGGMYAAAAITPIVALAFIGGILFIYLRKRKWQQVAAAQLKVQEIKTQPRPRDLVQPYMAPSLGSPPRYSASRINLPPSCASSPQPVILGPIPFGANGAYFSGMDTSDVVSVNSATNTRPLRDPFSDNNSLTEPPPPYRPRSIAPPSLTASSRNSSLRTSIPLPATSPTHVIERSPFDDPVDGDEDEIISELSGPTGERGDDAMSAVSDLSYQHDLVVSRTRS
jgi:hypothetical protein